VHANAAVISALQPRACSNATVSVAFVRQGRAKWQR
jgi:hypothetical protein